MNITAYDEIGNTFVKNVNISEGKHGLIVSLGYPYEWRYQDFINPPKNGDDKMYIDASGRNHKGSSVYVFHSELMNIVKKLLNLEPEEDKNPIEIAMEKVNELEIGTISRVLRMSTQDTEWELDFDDEISLRWLNHSLVLSVWQNDSESLYQIKYDTNINKYVL